MTTWKTALITIGLTLVALLAWEFFLRNLIKGFIPTKKDDENPSE